MLSRVLSRCAKAGFGACLAGVLSLAAVAPDAQAQDAGRKDTSFQYSAFYLGPSIDVLQGMARQADGKIVAAGYSRGFVVVRFMPDGTADASFGTAGVAAIGLNASNSTATYASVAIQPDGRILVASGASGFGLARLNANGTPDTGFGTGGIVTHLVSGLTGYTTSIRVMGDGRIVAAGYASNAGNVDFAIARYLSNGTLDTTFNGTGMAVVAVGTSTDLAYDMTIDTAGRILVGGYSFNGTDNDFALARLTPEGALDATFGAGGKVVTGISGNDGITNVFVLADGRLLAAGWTSSTQMALARYDANGALDATFGTGGTVTVTGGGGTRAALQTDGKIVMLATNSGNAVLARFNPGGSLDAGFGTAGLQTTPDPVSNADVFGSLLIQPDGTIVVGGTVDDDFALRRHGANGAVDATFGTTGLVKREIGRGEGGRWSAVRVLEDGRILAAGAQAGTTKAQVIVARFLESGAQDMSFGNGGVFAARCPYPSVAGMDVQPDGRIAVAGSCRWANDDLFALRLTPDGQPDLSFGGIGMAFADLGDVELAYAMALQADGKIIVGGQTRVASHPVGVVIRFAEDGALDTSFGNEGRAAFDLGGRASEIHALALQSDGKILAAGYNELSPSITVATVLRLGTGGTLDSTFSGDGVFQLMGPRGESLGFVDGRALLVETDRILIAGAGTSAVGGIIAGITEAGVLDTSFGTDGVIEIPQLDGVNHIARQWQSRLLAIGNVGSDIHARRVNVDGTEDTGFKDQDYGEGPSIGYPTGFAEAWNYKALVGGTTTPEFSIVRFALENFGTVSPALTTAVDVAPSTLITSATVTVTHGALPVRSRNGAFSVGCSGSFTAGPLVVATGQTLCVRHFSAATPGTTTTTQLAIGGATLTFSSVTARSQPTMSLAAQSASVRIGASTTLTATLSTSYGAPTGLVTFRDGVTPIATASVNASGVAQASVAFSTLGSHSITADYPGDAAYLPQASDPVVVTVVKADAVGNVLVSPSPSVLGALVTLSANVQGFFATGTVSFLDFGTAIPGCESIALSGSVANCATMSLAGGGHSITASYSGDANNNPSVSRAVPHLVTADSPDAFSFADQILVPLSTMITSAPVRITGLASSAPVTVIGGEWCASSANGCACDLRAFSGNPGTIANDQYACVRHVSSAVPGGSNDTQLIVGGLGDTFTTVTIDTVPAPFDLGSVSHAAPGSVLTSATVTITGINAPAPVAVLGGQYSIGCTGLFTGAPGMITNGQQVCVRHTASPVRGASTVTTLDVGGVQGDFVSTTESSTTIPRLANISTRMQVLTGDNVLIGGFIIGGSTPKTVAVRARGPSMTPLGVPGVLANPRLDLYSGQAVIAGNDDWQQAANAAAILSSGFAPADPLESTILTQLAPGPYTAIVSGVGGTTGVGIVEVFEVDNTDAPLINIATRGAVLTGADVMIGGFIIQGDGPQTVVVRARGPSLAAFGIANFLANPMLQLFSGQTQIATNDDWQTDPGASALQASGFAPAHPLESAIRITLNPGAYTAIVTGAGGTTGVAIVEVFAQ